MICAQLTQRGLDEYGTAEFINKHAEKNLQAKTPRHSIRDKWNLDFLTRAVKYRESARAFVKGGYRWLVHAQKPSELLYQLSYIG